MTFDCVGVIGGGAWGTALAQTMALAGHDVRLWAYESDTIREINQAGLTVVLVEQNARAALKLAHRGYVMEVGNIVLEDAAANLLSNPEVQNAYLGGTH